MTNPFLTSNNFLTAGIEHEHGGNSTNVQRELDRAGIDWIDIQHEHCGGENVFPQFPLPLDESNPAWADIHIALECFERAGCPVGRSGIGGHVHIGRSVVTNESKADYWEASKDAKRANRRRFYASPNQACDENLIPVALLKDVIRRYALHQDVINDHLPPSRTNCRWAEGISCLAPSGRDHSAFEAANTVSDIRNVLQPTGSKYFAINLLKYDAGTIEFRQGASSNEMDKWAAWCNLLLAMFQHSDHYRIDWNTSVGGVQVIQTPERLHRIGSRLDVTYQLCRRDGGATVQEIMAATGSSAQRIRSMITEIRQNDLMADDMVETLTQQHYNHRYGSSGGRFDQGGYEVHREITRSSPEIHGLLPENRIGQTSIFAGLDDFSFEVLSARRLRRIEQGTLTR